MKISLLTVFLTALLCTTFSCSKNATNNPCEGILNEAPPRSIGLIILDKQTGTNLIQANTIKADNLKVTDGATGQPLTGWRIVPTSNNSPFNGALELSLFRETAGDYTINVQINDFGTIVLSYTILQEKSDDPCRRYSYPMTDLKVSNYDWKLFEYESRKIPNVLVTEISLNSEH